MSEIDEDPISGGSSITELQEFPGYGASSSGNNDQAITEMKNTIFTATSSKLFRPNSDYRINVYVEPGNLASKLSFTATIGLESNPNEVEADKASATSTLVESGKVPPRGSSKNPTSLALFSSAQKIQVTPGKSGTIIIPVKNLGNNDISRYKLTLNGFDLNDDKKNFEKSAIIIKDDKEKSVLIQTDTPIYKPGETVKFRIIVLNRFLKPFKEQTSLIISIINTEYDIVKVFTEAKVNNYGLYSSEFEIPTESKSETPIKRNGKWRINVQDNTTGKYLGYSLFTVDKYVLRTLKIDFNLTPSYVTNKDSKFQVEIKAGFTFGKPINSGSVEVKLFDEYNYSYNYQLKVKNAPAAVIKKATLDKNGTALIEFDIMGELVHEISPEEKRMGFYSRQFKIEAIVTDGITGNIQNNSTNIRMYEHEYNVSLVEPPKYYKPGLPLTLTLKIAKHDGKPPTIINPDDNKAVKILHGFAYKKEDGELYFPMPADGIITFTLQSSDNVLFYTSSIQIICNGQTYYVTPPTKLIRKSGIYLELTILTKKPKLGSPLDVKVNVNKPINGLHYLIYGRGEILTYSHIETTDKEVQEFNITIPIPDGVVPEATILVYTVIGHEIAVDSKQFNIAEEVLHNHLTLSLSKTTANTGEEITLTMDTKPGSLVALRGIDQSVILMQDKNITMDTISKEIKSFKNVITSYNYTNDRSPTFQLFYKAGVVILTNCDFEVPVPDTRIVCPMDHSDREPDEISIRNNFLETWLWEEIPVNSNPASKTFVVPDSLTSWIITGYSLNMETGIGLTLNPIKLETFKPFFLTLNVPYSIVQGETFDFQVLEHNYIKNSVTNTMDISLTIENNEFIFNEEGPTDQNVTVVTKQLQFDPNTSIQHVTFTITPIKFGVKNLVVKGSINGQLTGIARTEDTLRHLMIVKPPGQKYTQNSTILLDLKSPLRSTDTSNESSTFSKSYQLEAKFPLKRVADADNIKLIVIGDLLRPTMTDIAYETQVNGYGCAERLTIEFASAIAILNYLDSSGILETELRTKSIISLEKCYKHLLSYKHDDGSFSSKGSLDARGSTLVTAFLIRTFIYGKPWITIMDDNVLIEPLKFLASRQNEDGSFIELGHVRHWEFPGYSLGTFSWSTFILLTFIEAKNMLPASTVISPPSTSQKSPQFNFEDVISKSFNYLIKSFDFYKDDPYTLNMITYALTLTGRPENDSFLKQLEEFATKEIDLIYWKPSIKNVPRALEKILTEYTCGYHGSTAEVDSIEMTSYGLMTYLLRNDMGKALSIAKWLRNYIPDFRSTIKFTALAKFVQATKSASNNLNIKVNYENGSSENIKVDNTNVSVKQETALPDTVRKVNLEVNGEGTALATLTWSYYMEEKLEEPAFSISSKISSPKPEIMELEISTSYLLAEKLTNDTLMEINLPSGYLLDLDQLPKLKKVPKVKNYDLQDGETKLLIYFEPISSDNTTVKILAKRMFKVKNPTKTYITVYDSSDTTLKGTEFYLPPPPSEISP